MSTNPFIKNITLLENKSKKIKKKKLIINKDNAADNSLEEIKPNKINEILIEYSKNSVSLNKYITSVNKFLQNELCEDCRKKLDGYLTEFKS